MIKVVVKNLQNEVTFVHESGSMDEATSWYEEQKVKGYFGDLEKDVLDGDGQPTGEKIPQQFSVDFEDMTAAVEAQEKVDERTAVRNGCNLVVDHIAAYNKEHLDAAALQGLFSQSWFSGAALALLLGAPDMAKGLIAAHGPSIYPQEFVDEVVAILEPLV